jgi:hypothetical protein
MQKEYVEALSALLVTGFSSGSAKTARQLEKFGWIDAPQWLPGEEQWSARLTDEGFGEVIWSEVIKPRYRIDSMGKGDIILSYVGSTTRGERSRIRDRVDAGIRSGWLKLVEESPGIFKVGRR